MANLAYSYYRLSREEADKNISSSIENQRLVISDYCRKNNLILVDEFIDDGYSGANFDRPGFQNMLKKLESGIVKIVLTKDLSRLGRTMVESSYYAEEFFPLHGIRYITTNDTFDSESENIMAPFQFAMNEVYLRDGSRKVRNVLKAKREHGQYCACPPYGYMKAKDEPKLVPDPCTSPIVQRIFEMAADGMSSRAIAIQLTDEHVETPLHYRAYNRDHFSAGGKSKVTEQWCYTTVKRIIRNEVYIGHTILGKQKKISIKSDKRARVPRENWSIHRNTHEPLVTTAIFEQANKNLGKGTFQYQQYDYVRKSIFGGIAKCALCGHSLCSCGTVYKGEREKYWMLSCTHQRQDIPNPCPGVRIGYAELSELVKKDINMIIRTSNLDLDVIARKASDLHKSKTEKMMCNLDDARRKLSSMDTVILNLYRDNANGLIDDEMFQRMITKTKADISSLKKTIEESERISDADQEYLKLLELARQYTEIDVLMRDILTTFVERIEVSPKVLQNGRKRATHKSTPFTQEVKIFYRFAGAININEDC